MRISPNAALESDLLKLKKFDYQDILNSVHVESFMMVDSVERKGLFTRLGNAISGKCTGNEHISWIFALSFDRLTGPAAPPPTHCLYFFLSFSIL